MRSTVDLPDELYRRAKAEAAVRGCNFKSANSAETPNSSPLTASVDGDPAGLGRSGKKDCPDCERAFLICTRTDQI
jgi:hypothetical protein